MNAKPSDFASLHNSIYAATQQRSALNVGQSSSSAAQNTNDTRGQSEVRGQGYETNRSVSSSVYGSGKGTGQNSFDSNTGQSDLSEQSSLTPDPQSAILQSTRSIIGIGHNPQSIQSIYASSNTGNQSSQSQRSLPSIPSGVKPGPTLQSTPFIDTQNYSQQGTAPMRGQTSGQGLLKTTNQKQGASIVDTLTNPFARQYPRPSVQAMESDINDNSVPQRHQNGGSYQSTSNVLTRRGSSSFHGIGGKS